MKHKTYMDILYICIICWHWGGKSTWNSHYDDVIMSTMASQITNLTIVYSSVYSGADQRKHQSSASLAFVRGIHRGPVNSPHKWQVTQRMFPFDDDIMTWKTRGLLSRAISTLSSQGISGHGIREYFGFTTRRLEWLYTASDLNIRTLK